MKRTTKLTLTALMAALCYVAFALLQIPIMTPVGKTSIHLGNVFCVLAALLVDGVSGGVAGAIGMAIGDLLDPLYVITAPKTIFLKFFIGFITGIVAHKLFHIHEKEGKELTKAVFLSVIAGIGFNWLFEPIISYLYYGLILQNSDKALSYLNIAKWITTSINTVLTIIIAPTIYLGIRKRLNIDDKFR